MTFPYKQAVPGNRGGLFVYPAGYVFHEAPGATMNVHVPWQGLPALLYWHDTLAADAFERPRGSKGGRLGLPIIDASLRTQEWILGSEAAEILGVSPNYVRRLVNLHRLKPRKIGTALLYRLSEVEDYKASHPRLGKRRGSTKNRPLQQLERDPVLRLRGVGKELWVGLGSDEYVSSLRTGWAADG